MKNSQDIISELLEKYSTAREFARAIGEDPADIARWKSGSLKIKARSVVAICRLHPEYTPYDLNPTIFAKDLRFSFGEY